jgi:hypothetical protein
MLLLPPRTELCRTPCLPVPACLSTSCVCVSAGVFVASAACAPQRPAAGRWHVAAHPEEAAPGYCKARRGALAAALECVCLGCSNERGAGCSFPFLPGGLCCAAIHAPLH